MTDWEQLFRPAPTNAATDLNLNRGRAKSKGSEFGLGVLLLRFGKMEAKA